MISPSRLLALSLAALCLATAATAGPALAAVPAWQPIAVSGPTNLPPQQSETQRLWVDAEGGIFTLTADPATTAPLPFNASAAEVQAALNALSTIGGAGASVSVAGGPGGVDAAHPYVITYGGSLANTDVDLLTTDASSLTGSGRSASVLTTVPGGPGTGTIAAYAQNIGGIESTGTITMSVALPPGVTTSSTPALAIGDGWDCSPGAGQQSFTCTSVKPVQPGNASVPVSAPVEVDAGANGTEPVQVTISEGGAPDPASYTMPLRVSPEPAGVGIQAFTAAAYDEDGVIDTRAGGHPYAGSTAIFANTYRNHFGRVVPVGEPKDIEVDLPPGFLGNPIATPECPEEALTRASPGVQYCPPDTIVGRAAPVLGGFGVETVNVPVYNVEAPLGYPGKFYFNVLDVPIHAVGSVRSDSDYGLTVSSLNTAQIATVYGSFFTFWGSPADESHDEQRCLSSSGCNKPSTVEETAFLTSPVDCAREALEQPIARLRLTTWQSPLITHVGDVSVPPVKECENLEFDADFTFEPSDTKSDSPASFRTELSIPSEGLTDPDKLMTPTINESVVELPKGVVLNASAADGLAACSKEQIGLKGTNFPPPNRIRFSKDPQSCPDASKIGSGELKSELLADPLQGALYLAAQGEGNPFGSLFAIYLVIEDPRHGIFIKLPGEVQVSEADGQQRIVFRDLPQLPFTYLRLNLKGGNRAPLASPTTCGNFVTTATNTPWSAPESGPPTASANGFDINQGPNGQPCANTLAERPFNLGWKAGSESTSAGAKAPFTFRITRPDGSQELDTLELATPQGLAASLKGVPYCSAAQIAQVEANTGRQEQANPACPAASQVGMAVTGAGSGPTPFYTPGRLYLAGPYKGAPISVLAVTPAVAGPFDLGNVVVRTAVFINRNTAQVSAKTDPIPQLLKGVALRIKDVRIFLDRKDWTLNPTSCDPLSVNLKATGNSGATANLNDRFQVGNCDKLGFKPKVTAKVIGGTKRNSHPAFRAEVTYPEGAYANLKDVQVALPHSEFLDQSHINTVCTRAQAASQTCPAGSVYGFAEATTPLLDGKLTGPVFLKSSVHKLPDLAIFLKGPDSQPVEVEFQGRIDSIHGQIRNTIEGLPDVPVSKFVLSMKGGNKGLLVNSRDLCKGKPGRMTVKTVGHNNKRYDTRPKLGNSCGKKAKKAKKKNTASKSQRMSGLAAFW